MDTNYFRRQSLHNNYFRRQSLHTNYFRRHKGVFYYWRGRKSEDPKTDKETLANATAFEKRKIDGTGDNDNKRKKPRLPNFPCCSRSHELAFCPEFRKKDVNARWDVVKKQKLSHVCVKAGHFRENCRYVEFCPCDSQRKHHLLLHNTKSNENKKEMKDEKKLPKQTSVLILLTVIKRYMTKLRTFGI